MRTPLRGDLADIALAGQVFAPHYAVPMPMRVAISTPLLAEMEPSADLRAELCAGAGFAALDIVGGYIWGYASDGDHEGLVGFVAKEALVKAELA